MYEAIIWKSFEQALKLLFENASYDVNYKLTLCWNQSFL